ncbi:aminotransferase class III-fold pyridoxal phosphate-dependent enzyme [Gordonia sp. X0973]|uniref:aminotransferase class III-fold pyridoxal phosphate-dependent enzyme n=1 Tax=Gordonia sp. X0973 TaxID=2742602 RepID=UPI000F545EAF|nr:aminotransferase class III-fold pyridoxal phosphate-dependent enzyme [Gordonia sp. X0973]QKT06056.1 aminotransferase class III-fold pyridoxal phosphate-dependent enzyme [Gordonia sp. X0973]
MGEQVESTGRGRHSRPLGAGVLAVRGAVEAVRLLWWSLVFGCRAAITVVGKTGDERNRAYSRVLRSFLLRMGPMYIKAGQVLGTQTGLLTTAGADEFREFFSGVPPMSQRRLGRVLRAEFPDGLERVFADFDRHAIAAGSVAEVHRATLLDGTPVAVKIVKRGVREQLQTSTWTIDKMLRVLTALIPPLRAFDAVDHFNELRPLLIDQCDMLSEANKQQTMRDNFTGHPYATVPHVHHEVCSENFLVMEYIDQTLGEDFDRLDYPGSTLARRLQDTFYTMAFFHGNFHVDPHPGNMMFDDDGMIYMLDFGLVGKLDEDSKWALASFYYAAIRGEWDLAVARFTGAFVPKGEALLEDPTYTEALEAVLRKHFSEISDHWSTMAFFDDATRVLRGYGARVTTAFSLLGLAFLTGEGVVSVIDPEIDIWDNARRFTDMFSPFMSDDLKAKFDDAIESQIPLSMGHKNDPERKVVAPTHFDRYALPSAYPLIVDTASGCRVTDIDGNTYIDLASGYGPHILGYAPQVAIEATSAALAKGAVNALGNTAEIELAEIIADAFGDDTRVVFSNSGTESAIMALRIARAHTGKQRIAKFEGHYHGFSDQGMVSSWFRYSGPAHEPRPVSNSAGAQQCLVDETMILQYGSEISLQRITAAADELAAVILEPMPASQAGYDAEFLAALVATCRQAGVLVIFDEVVTGFRVAYGGAQTLAGVTPDMTCLGKIIGGGLPGGAVVGRSEVIATARTSDDPFVDLERKAFVGGTMSGNSITAAAGAAVLGHLRDNPQIYVDLDNKTEYLKSALEEASRSAGVACRIKGARSIFSTSFDYAKPKLVRDQMAGANIKATLALSYYMRKHGVYLPELHTMLLNDAHQIADLDQVADAFRESLIEMDKEGFFVH